jgi:hypothetical protein
LLPSWKVVAAAAAGIVTVIVVGASWVYLVAGRSAPPQHAAIAEQAPPGTAAPRTPPAVPRPPAGKPAENPLENTDLQNRLAAADASLAALTERLAALDREVREAVASARAASERADTAARQLDEARKSGDEHEAAQQLDRGALDDLATRIKTLESRQMTVRQIQERLDRLAGAAGSPDKTARVAIAVTVLRNAVERDRPFAVELAAVRALGVDDDGALAALEPFAATGLPRRNELFRELSALLPELRRAAAPPAQDLGYLERIQASAARMLNIRPAKDEPGDDPPAVLSRIEFKMAHEDIDAIVAELDKLPPAAKELARPWRTRALARRDTMEAVRLMAAAALGKLGDLTTSGSSPQ